MRGVFVADYVYYELLGGGDPVVGLEAFGPVVVKREISPQRAQRKRGIV